MLDTYQGWNFVKKILNLSPGLKTPKNSSQASGETLFTDA